MELSGRAASGRVLWVTEESPDRALGGGSIRQSHLFEALARAVPTDLLLVGSLGDERVRSLAGDVTEFPKRLAPWTNNPLARRALELGVTLGSRYPLPAYRLAPTRRLLAGALRAREHRYSLMCVEHEALAPIAQSLTVPSVITFHHVLSEMIGQELVQTTGRRQRWFLARDMDKARRLERAAVQSYTRVIACSEGDADALARIGGSDSSERIAVVPNGVDLDAIRQTPVPPQPRVLFPGSLAYAPNVDGVRWFCTDVWPEVRRAVQDASLVLAGWSPVPAVRELEQIDGVSVHPDVPSMTAYLEWARAVIVPLRIGTGTRLKALEAMAAGRPVVGTSIGLDGIGAVDAANARIANDAPAFAGAVIDVLRHDGTASALGAAGRKHVEERFGWERIGTDFVAVLSELLSARVMTTL